AAPPAAGRAPPGSEAPALTARRAIGSKHAGAAVAAGTFPSSARTGNMVVPGWPGMDASAPCSAPKAAPSPGASRLPLPHAGEGLVVIAGVLPARLRP